MAGCESERRLDEDGRRVLIDLTCSDPGGLEVELVGPNGVSWPNPRLGPGWSRFSGWLELAPDWRCRASSTSPFTWEAGVRAISA